ncbi:transcriptional regulator [Achromobacter spanius]|uniref:transcriptional regulator n=1 Tax=Achromobacter spanius TaxID=217203 RepID=UPI00067E38E4
MMIHEASDQYGPSYEALKKAIALAGTQEALAQMLGVTQPAVNKMLKSKAPLGAHHCVRIMTHLGISRQELRPTDYWEVWPDLPEPSDQDPTCEAASKRLP